MNRKTTLDIAILISCLTGMILSYVYLDNYIEKEICLLILVARAVSVYFNVDVVEGKLYRIEFIFFIMLLMFFFLFFNYKANKMKSLNSQFLCKKIEEEYEITLYDKKDNEVCTLVYPVEPWIKEITDNVLEIGVSTGNPSSYVFYFDKETSKISETYFNPILINNKYIAYMENDEMMILMDIFDEGILHKEIERNFSKFLNPIAMILPLIQTILHLRKHGMR